MGIYKTQTGVAKKSHRKGGKYVKPRQKRHGGWWALACVLLVLAGAACFGIYRSVEQSHRGGTGVKIRSVEEAIREAKRMGETYGYQNAMSEMTEKVTTEIDGDCYYRLQQNYKGIPVYGRTVVYVTDENGTVKSITGNIQDVDNQFNPVATVSEIQVISAVRAYLADENALSNSCSAEKKITDPGNLCIYSYCGELRTVYRVYAGNSEVFVDAQTADILASYIIFYENSETSTGDADKQQGWKQEDGTYILRDPQRNIYIYDAGRQTYWPVNTNDVNIDVVTLVSSKDNVFGNLDDSTQTANTAVSFLEALSKVYDFYNIKFHEKGHGILCAVYDDAMGTYEGDNGGGGVEILNEFLPEPPPEYNDSEYGGKIGFMTIGYAYSDDFCNYYDLLGHEYTHVVSAQHVNWNYTLPEAGAINEGLSDIFGILIEESLSDPGNAINWMFGSRNIRSPSANGYPEKVGEIKPTKEGEIQHNNGKTDFSHGCSTIISHAAYLMWNGIDGRTAEKISSEDLANLWYRAMLMMPSDCTFTDCRRLVELVASSMNLTDAQKQCVSEAFDAVEIPRIFPNGTSRLYRNFRESGKTAIKGTVYEVKEADGVEKVLPVPNAKVAIYCKSSEAPVDEFFIDDKGGFFEKELPTDTYSVVVSAEGYVGQTVTFVLQPDETKYLSIQLSLQKQAFNIDQELPEMFFSITSSLNARWEFMLQNDGFFDSVLKIFNFGERGEGYPLGTGYITKISGNFTNLEKINDTTYRMTVEKSGYTERKGTTYIEDDTRYIVENEVPIDPEEVFYLFLPRTPRSELPQGLVDSVNNNGHYSMNDITPSTYVLYCLEPEHAGYERVFIGKLDDTMALESQRPTEAANNLDMSSTFGYTKAWEIHDYFGTDHFVTSLAFQDNGTFCCGIGYYLSDWAATFSGIYEVNGDEITLRYTINGEENTNSYRVSWEKQTMELISDQGLNIAHHTWSEYHFKESPDLTAEGLLYQVELFQRFLREGWD